VEPWDRHWSRSQGLSSRCQQFDLAMKIHCVELTRQGRSETPDELFQCYRELAATGHRHVPGGRTSRYAETSPQTYRPNRTTKQTLASRR
jgi:hypothetical protein